MLENRVLKNKILVGFGCAALVGVSFFGGKIFETNDAGYYQVKQAALIGEMSVHNEPGVYAQLFGNIFTYKVSETSYFSDAEGNDIGAVILKPS